MAVLTVSNGFAYSVPHNLSDYEGYRQNRTVCGKRENGFKELGQLEPINRENSKEIESIFCFLLDEINRFVCV